jgi:hypothetical protein
MEFGSTQRDAGKDRSFEIAVINMYIKEGIAYAGELTPPIRVKSVKAMDDYRLLLTFTNGEKRIFDCKPLLSYKVFNELKDMNLFRQAYIDYGTVVWNDVLDYAPEALYSDSVPV